MKSESDSGKEGGIFGAFTDIPWTSSGGYKAAQGNSFIFSLRDNQKFEVLKCKESGIEVIHRGDLLASYGYQDIIIFNDCNIVSDNRSDLGLFYEPPKIFD